MLLLWGQLSTANDARVRDISYAAAGGKNMD